MICSKDGVDDGARTHDRRNHNPELYQLSYAHHCFACQITGRAFYGAPGRPLPAILAYTAPAHPCAMDSNLQPS